MGVRLGEPVGEVEWIARNLRVRDKAGRIVPLVPWRSQLRLLARWGAQEAAGLPVRLLLLKHRQGGFSTATEGLIYARCHNLADRNGLVAAHDDDSSTKLFDMCHLFQESLAQADLARPLRHSSKKELRWKSPHRSHLVVQTAGNIRLGRSRTLDYLHLSEAAWWSNAKQSLLSVLQAVPELPGTAVVIESTANGIGGEFYDRWQAAVAAQRDHPGSLEGFQPLFFSWLDFGEYRWPLPPSVELRDEDLDDEELHLRTLGADDEQLYWRRRILADKCGGDVDLFKQEYPATPDEAFISTGRGVFAPAIIRHHRSMVAAPRLARLVWDAACPNGVRGVFGEGLDRQGSGALWWVWRVPQEGHDYTVGGDVCEGTLADPADSRSDPDWNGGAVLDRVELLYAAVARNRLDPDLWGMELLKCACWYHRAWGSPEANAPGVGAILVWKRRRYQRTYRRQQLDERVDVQDASALGWKTTGANRDLLIDDYLAACRADPDSGWEDRIRVFSELLVGEEETFTRDEHGKRQHRLGCHDDVLFAAMIAWQLHLRCPRTYRRAFEPRSRRRVEGPGRPAGVGVGDYDPGVEGPQRGPVRTR